MAAPIPRLLSATPITTPAVTAGYNYPNNSDTCTNTGTQRCKFSYAVHGLRLSVLLHDFERPVLHGADQWLGHGHMRDRQDFASTKYVRYAAGTTAPGFDAATFTRVDITPSGCRVTAGGASVNGAFSATCPSGRTVAQEQANFAKFYAFNRTRVLLMKTAGGIAFSNYVGTNLLRAGYHSLWENSSATAGFLNVKDFNSANAATWFSKFYAASPDKGTPLPDAMWRIGEYFSNGEFRAARRHRPARSDHRQVPAELPPAVDRWVLEQPAGQCNWQLGQDGSHLAHTRCRPDHGRELSAALLRRADGEEQQPGRSRDVLLGPRPPYGQAERGQGFGRPVAARRSLRACRRRARESCVSDGHRQHYIRCQELAADVDCESVRPGVDRRPLARRRQQPRQVLQRAESAAARREHRHRARGFHRPERHGRRGGARRSAAQRDQPIRLQDQLRKGLVGRRQEICDRHQHRCAPRRCRRQSAQCPAVVGRDAIGRAGGRSRCRKRLGYTPSHRNHEQFDGNRRSLPPRESVGRAAVIAQHRVEQPRVATHASGRVELPARRQIERGRQHDQFPDAVPYSR